MGLRAQVFAVGLIVLLLPVLAWQSVRQLHVALQQERIETQTRRVATLRAVLAGSPALAERLSIERFPAASPAPQDWFAERAPWPLFVDGYADDWQALVERERRVGNLGLRVARRDGRLFLFVRVSDDDVIHHLPPRLDADAGENERPRREELLVNGDALEVFVARPGGERTHALLRVIAPGPVQVVRAGGRGGRGGTGQLARWRAEWVDDADGYQVEIELPLPEAGSRVGLAAIDVARVGGPRDVWSGTMDPSAMRDEDGGGDGDGGGGGGGTLRYESDVLQAQLRPWVFPGTRARLFDEHGLLLAEADALYAAVPGGRLDDAEDGGAERAVDGEDARVGTEAAPQAGTSVDADGNAVVEPDAVLDPSGIVSSTLGLLDVLLLRLFAWFAAGDLPLFPETEKRRQPLHLDAVRLAAIEPSAPTRRYVTVDNDRVLGTLVGLPVASAAGERRAYLLFESNEEHASAFTGSRLARLFALLAVASLAVTLLLFAWATRLSLRVRGLSRAVAAAIDAEGRIEPSRRRAPLVESAARDEVGQLSRDLSALLERSSAYTRYLERLSSRLSHELGTPLSIVRSSLENIAAERLDPESRTLVARAGDGAERLGHIVRALLASTRLEQSVRHASFAPLELRAWLEEARAQYAQVHPRYRFRVLDSLEALERQGSGATVTPGRDPASSPPLPPPPSSPPPPLRATVAATLLRQALDKLVENAVDFATEPDIALLLYRERVAGSGRRVGDEAFAERVTLAVANVGAALGEEGAERLFEAGWSSRGGFCRARPAGETGERDVEPSPASFAELAAGEAGGEARGKRSGEVHGGLGLHLVALIADAHRGEVFALDRAARPDRPVDALEPALRPGARVGEASPPARANRVIVGVRLPIGRDRKGDEPPTGGG